MDSPEKGEVWWTESLDTVSQVEIIDDLQPLYGPARIYLYHKPCLAWSDHDTKGGILRWDGLHARAKEFLFTEGTFQRLSEDNASYAKSLIGGDDLSPWHNRRDWRRKADSAKRAPVTHYDARGKTIVRMAMTAMATAAQSGDISVAVKKDKDFRFRSQIELETHRRTPTQPGLHLRADRTADVFRRR